MTSAAELGSITTVVDELRARPTSSSIPKKMTSPPNSTKSTEP